MSGGLRARRLSLVAAFAMTFGGPLIAPRGASAEPELAVETPPLALVFRGAGLGVRLRPSRTSHVAIAGGVYFYTAPRLFTDMGDNADEGWTAAIRPGVFISGDYYLGRHGTGVAFGAALVVSRFVIGNDNEPGTTSYESVYLVPRVSYTQPVWRALYVTPSLGVELHKKVAGSTELGTRSFTPLSVTPTFVVQLGYHF